MKNEIIIAIVSSIFGSLITCLFKFLLDKRKEKREDKKKMKEFNFELNKNRPEMQITEYKNYLSREGYGIKRKCDIDVFIVPIENIEINGEKKNKTVLAHYNEDLLKKNEWCCVLYTLENIGKTDISSVDIIFYLYKTACMFPSEYANDLIKNNTLNYSFCYDRKIRCGESITLKICYHKDHIITGFFSAAISIGMIDDNGCFWSQALFAPNDKIYESTRLSSKEYGERLDTKAIEECFCSPELW